MSHEGKGVQKRAKNVTYYLFAKQLINLISDSLSADNLATLILV